MDIVCRIAGILCLIYYIVLKLHAGSTVDFSWLWLVSGIVFLILGLLLHRSQRLHPDTGRPWRIILGVLLTMGITLVLCGCGMVISAMRVDPPDGLEYVIVLGAQVRGRTPSRSLTNRLVCALEYAQRNEDTVLILSGGKGKGEEITEARCMYNYLKTHGIREDRLIMEENSTSTKENILFSDTLTGCGSARTGIVSNNFHICRAVILAETLGFREVWGIPAPSDPFLQIHYIVREVFALTWEKLTGEI